MKKGNLFLYIQNHAQKGEVAIYCRVLGVTPQGYKKHLQIQSKPYKYAQLLADMYSILDEDIFNSTYGKQKSLVWIKNCMSAEFSIVLITFAWDFL